MRRKFSFVRFLVCLIVGASASSGVRGAPFEALDTLLNEEVAKGTVPSISMVVVQGDRVIYRRSVGVSRVGEGRRAKANDLYRSASTLKMMVGAALAKLHVNGRIDLHAPISRYVEGLHPRVGMITTHQLLTHTSGILDESSDDGSVAVDALAQRMKKLAGKDLFLSPGEAFSYSNPGYSLAGYVLEEVTGMPFSEALKQLLFDPAQMARSTFALGEAESWGMAYPHRGEGAGLHPITPKQTGKAAEPSGTMLSTVDDYGRFLIAMLNGGYIGGSMVLPTEAVEMMLTPQVSRDRMITSYLYSYGLMVGEFAGYEAMFHSGGMPGFASNVLLVPEHKIGIVLFTNGESLDRRHVLRTALGSLLPKKESTPLLEEGRKYTPVTIEEAQGIVGLYMQRSDLPTIRVHIKDGGVWLLNRGRDYRLHHYGNGDYIGISKEKHWFWFRIPKDANGQGKLVQWWIRAFARVQE